MASARAYNSAAFSPSPCAPRDTARLLSVIAPRLINHGQIVQRRRDLVMLPSVNAGEDSERAVVQFFGLVELALPVEQRGQRSHGGGDLRMVVAVNPAAQFDRFASERLALGETSSRVLQPANVVIDRSGLGAIPAVMIFQNRQRPAVTLRRLVEPARE